jgi:ribosomal protein S18 acetylase RimI-like enzyme
MIIREAHTEDLPIIEKLAHEIWWPTYQHYLSKEQITLMLQLNYSVESLQEQTKNNHTFLILESEGNACGFLSYSSSETHGLYKIHKIYIHPSTQGKGAGKFFISSLENLLKKQGANILELNVNRSNPAKNFYLKMGFEIYKEIDIPFDKYILDDYIMRKAI